MLWMVFGIMGVSLWAGVQPLDSATKKKHTGGTEIQLLATPELHKTENAFMAYMTIPAGAKVPLHRDASEEYLFIISGEGTLWIDGQPFKVRAQDTVFMPANSEVRFENSNKPLKAIQVFAGPESAKKYQGEDWK